MFSTKFLLGLTASVMLITTLTASAQMVDRPALLARIDLLHSQLQAKEQVFVAPSSDDLAAFSEFLRQPNTGMARLMPREKYDGKMLMRGGGAYYSFLRLTNEYGYSSDIGLEQGLLRSGFAGADFGFITLLGDVPIEDVTLDQPGIRYLVSFNTPTTLPEAREQQRRSSTGFEVDGFTYRCSAGAITNTTYALRSVSYTTSDVLVVFRVTRRDTDGSFILLWKLLKTFSTPILAAASLHAAPMAASVDRAQLETEIQQLLTELKATEQQYLEPSAKDRAKFADFLAQPDTGLVRLLPRGTFQNRLTTLGGAAYYSFARLTHEYGYGSDLELQLGNLMVGFAGADFGFLTLVGKVPIEELTLDHPAAQFLATFVAPSAEPEARAQASRSNQGFEANGFTYKSQVPVKTKRAYLLRSISYGRSDLIVAFRVTSQDDDGSVVLVWKILKRFTPPQLIQTQSK